MGVPKFYRWISERYPCLSENVKEYQVPEFDNLYFDMNGIIHVCSHPNDDDPHFRITEEQIFKDIFHYIEVLFRIVCPRKVFFMAVDGVAPRAKMNQQRGRRFRSAKEAEENIKKALAKGEELPKEKRFDSNCITPGTKFMVRLQQQLEYMVKCKVTTDPAWQGIRIYLSGHETPGEGEHKIMEFIRNERMQEGYDANTRHCLYGLDADLMMLGLCCHEPHFSLLREEVRFTGKKKHSARTAKPEQTTFHLLHLSLMREYIDHEFQSLKNTLPFQYDLESIIDDWVLMGFLVGNDFIPHLPHLHIAHNALPMLYSTYMQVLPTLDGYLNEGGLVNLRRFGKYLEHLAQFDWDKFEEVFADFKWLESKVGKKKKTRQSRPQDIKKSRDMSELNSFGSLEDDSTSTSFSESEISSEQKSIKVITDLSIKQGLTSQDSDGDSLDQDGDTSTYKLEFELYKRNYYQEKLHFTGTEAEVAKIAYEYVLAIQWICHYYYNGVQSWSWYYPYHYAPYLSDLRNVSKMKLTYDMAKPFLPYEQLLAVLPAGSKECLPERFWELMSSPTSPIIDYYPTNFTCDLNGKQQEWEAVVLIPFINESRLLAAMRPCLEKLNKVDKERNRHSGCQLYTFDSNLDFYVKSSCVGTFPNIAHCKARMSIVPLHAWSSSEISTFVKGLLPGCKLSVYYPGFPTLYHLPHKASLQKRGVKVFQMPSRNENTILSILPPQGYETNFGGQPYSENDTIEDVAKRLLGTSIFVNWPHMEEAKVVAVSDENTKYEVTEHIHATGNKGSKHKMRRKSLSHKDQDEFWQEISGIKETLLERRGIDVGETQFLVYAQLLLGRQYICSMQGQITLEKQWATSARPYALQATVKDISVKDPSFQRFKGMEELFPIDSSVFMLGHPHYGSQGKVTQVQHGMVSLELHTPNEPDVESVIRQRHKLSSRYYQAWELAGRMGISTYLLSRVTGTIFVFYPTNRKWQVGLNLRFTKESSGIAGYTKFVNRQWLYSEAVEKTLVEYMEKFPNVLKYLQSALHRNENEFDAAEMTRETEMDDVIDKLKEVTSWLKTLDCYHGDKINQYSDILESSVVQSVMQKVEDSKEKKTLQPIQISLTPHLLYRPIAHQGTLIPDKAARHWLLDRIVNVRDSYTVPLGLRGTIIGIHQQPGEDVLYDVVFDEEFLGGLELGGRCPKRKGYRMPECAMINLTHGMRLSSKDKKPTAIVKPHHKQQNAKQIWSSQRGEGAYQHGGQVRNTNSPNSNRTEQRRHQNHRPQSANPPYPQSANPTSIMPRPNSSQNQAKYNEKESTRTKMQSQNQSPANDMFDALWRTLKEEKRMCDETNRPPKEKQSVKSSVSKKSDASAVPIITAPAVHHVKAPDVTELIRQADNLSLAKAAMSLPKVESLPKTKVKEKESASNIPVTAGGKITSPLHGVSVTNPTTTMTQANSSLGNKESEHLNNLFKSIKVSHSKSSFSPRLAFTPTQALHHTYSQPGARTSMQPNIPYNHYYQPDNSMLHGSEHAAAGIRPHAMPYQNPGIPPMFMRPPFYQQNLRYSGHGGMPFPPFRQPPYQQPQTKSHSFLTNEGIQRLSEMPQKETEDASSKWSSGEVEEDADQTTEDEKQAQSSNEAAQDLSKHMENLKTGDTASDVDSEKDEDFIERSTSVEDKDAGTIKKPTSVEELLRRCNEAGLPPPVYTYFSIDNGQIVATIQLYNGLRLSCSPQKTKDKAMEDVASQGLAVLKAELQGGRANPPGQQYVTTQYLPTHPAFASPVTYATAPQAFYYHTPTYMVPSRPVIPIAPDNQHHALMHPHLRYGPQYAHYLPHYPYVTAQVSPTHQVPPMWRYQPKDFSPKDIIHKPKTEFKILDQPPVQGVSEERPHNNSAEVNNGAGSNTSNLISGNSGNDGTKTKNNTSIGRKQESQSKAKLAISFNQGRK